MTLRCYDQNKAGRKGNGIYPNCQRGAAIVVRKIIGAAIAAIAFGQAAIAQDGKLTVELNKLETGEEGACRAFFMFRNQNPMSFEEFEISLAVLDRDQIIDRLLTIDAAPLPALRTTLKLFDIPEIACTDISEIIIHDIPACKPQNGEPMECFAILDLVSRADVRLSR
jgi:hypothetical protein